MSVKYSKWPNNLSTFSNLRHFKIYPNWDFRFENKPSSNPAQKHFSFFVAAEKNLLFQRQE
jgi:hypothetical protein